MSQTVNLISRNRYEIKIQGHLDDAWLGWFEGAAPHFGMLADNTQVTTFSNVVMDQAGLVGLIRRLHGHGVVLLSVCQVCG